MRSRIGNILLAFLTAGMVTILAACSSAFLARGDHDSERDQPIVDEPGSKAVTFTIFTYTNPRIKDMNANWFTKHLEEKFHVSLGWDLAAYDSADQEKQLMLAGGDYPEVIMYGLSASEQYNLGTQGVLRPLNDLIDEYAPHIRAAFEENSALRNGATSADGNIYSIPQYAECFHCYYGEKMWINQKFLDNLGLKMPETIEEFYHVLKAFKERDPNGNGKADEIPLSGAIHTWNGDVFGFLMNPFIYDNQSDYLMMKDGTLEFIANKPEYKEGLKYIRRLFVENLIDPLAFIQNVDSLEQIGSDPDEILGAFTAGHMAIGVPLTTPNQRNYVAVPPLIGPGGQVTGYSPYTYNEGAWSVTDKASDEQAVAAIRIADYMYSEEGTILAMYGPEGVFWRKANPGEKDFNGKQAVYYLDTGTYQSENTTVNEYWIQSSPTAMTEALRDKFAAPSGDIFSPNAYEYRLFRETKDKYQGHEPKELFPSALPFKPEEAEEVAQLKTSLQTYIEQYAVRFVTGDQDIDEGWDEYVNGFRKLNLERYVALHDEAYRRMSR